MTQPKRPGASQHNFPLLQNVSVLLRPGAIKSESGEYSGGGRTTVVGRKNVISIALLCEDLSDREIAWLYYVNPGTIHSAWRGYNISRNCFQYARDSDVDGRLKVKAAWLKGCRSKQDFVGGYIEK